MAHAFAEIAFTPAAREVQRRQGSAGAYDRFLAPETERGDRLGEREAEFIAARDGFYQATVSQTGWPYVQFRGGPAGFLKVLDDRTIAYADFRGNRQYLSTGNLAGNDRVALILMDYPNRRRLKVLGHARTIDIADDPGLIARLHDGSYRAKPERAVVISIAGLDWNCPQHIPKRMTLAELEPYLAPLRTELAELKAENDLLKSSRDGRG
jgi:uncharacterized protein